MGAVKISTFLFLGINAWTDWRKKEISLSVTGLYVCFGIIFSITSKREFQDCFLPLMMGILFLFFSIVSKGALGMGDGWILIALGLVLKTETYIRILAAGILMAAGVSLCLLMIFQRNRKTEIPFVPFLFLAYIGDVII